MKTIRTLLADDHVVIREGLAAILSADDRIEVVAEACNGREAVNLAMALHPEVVVMDIGMPVLNGLDAAREIMTAAPSTKVIILSAHCEDAHIDRFVSLGAYGFLIKQESADSLVKAVCRAMEGKMTYSPEVALRIKTRAQAGANLDPAKRVTPISLTARETETLQLVAEGHSNKQIAGILGISTKTVEKHRQRLMDKLNIRETASLTRFAAAQGIIERRVAITT